MATCIRGLCLLLKNSLRDSWCVLSFVLGEWCFHFVNLLVAGRFNKKGIFYYELDSARIFW